MVKRLLKQGKEPIADGLFQIRQAADGLGRLIVAQALMVLHAASPDGGLAANHGAHHCQVMLPPQPHLLIQVECRLAKGGHVGVRLLSPCWQPDRRKLLRLRCQGRRPRHDAARAKQREQCVIEAGLLLPLL